MPNCDEIAKLLRKFADLLTCVHVCADRLNPRWERPIALCGRPVEPPERFIGRERSEGLRAGQAISPLGVDRENDAIAPLVFGLVECLVGGVHQPFGRNEIGEVG